MRPDDLIRLRHMLESALEATAFVANKERSSLDRDRVLTLALMKSIEIIGEAASKISDETKADYRQIPWIQIVGMRNRLIHAYHEVDLDVLWHTVIDDLPPLIDSVKRIVELNSDKSSNDI